jgi:transposase
VSTEPPQEKPVDLLGMDFGIKNIVTDSDGKHFSDRT